MGVLDPETMLRPYSLYHRPLFGRLCQAAYQTAQAMIAAASPTADPITPGMIAVVQTFSDNAGWNPHIHALATRGGWDRAGQWVGVPFIDGEAAGSLIHSHSGAEPPRSSLVVPANATRRPSATLRPPRLRFPSVYPRWGEKGNSYQPGPVALSSLWRRDRNRLAGALDCSSGCQGQASTQPGRCLLA
jgi:hypothetical protein